MTGGTMNEEAGVEESAPSFKGDASGSIPPHAFSRSAMAQLSTTDPRWEWILRWGPPIAIVVVPAFVMLTAALAIPDRIESSPVRSSPSVLSRTSVNGTVSNTDDDLDSTTEMPRTSGASNAPIRNATTVAPPRPSRRGFSPVRERETPPPVLIPPRPTAIPPLPPAVEVTNAAERAMRPPPPPISTPPLDRPADVENSEAVAVEPPAEAEPGAVPQEPLRAPPPGNAGEDEPDNDAEE